MMKIKNNFLLFFGSIIIVVFSLLAAFIPRLAYVTVNTYFLPDGPFLPSVVYPALDFSPHVMTLKLLVSAFGGLLALFSLFEVKKKTQYVGFAGILLGNIGFLLPTEPRGSFPIYRYFDIPWAGYLLALIGFLMMLTGFAIRGKFPRFTLLSVPLLLTAYLAAPLLIISGNLQLFAHIYLNNSVNMLIGLTFAGHLIVFLGVIIGIIKYQKRLEAQQKYEQINEKRS